MNIEKSERLTITGKAGKETSVALYVYESGHACPRCGRRVTLACLQLLREEGGPATTAHCSDVSTGLPICAGCAEALAPDIILALEAKPKPTP